MSCTITDKLICRFSRHDLECVGVIFLFDPDVGLRFGVEDIFVADAKHDRVGVGRQRSLFRE